MEAAQETEAKTDVNKEEADSYDTATAIFGILLIFSVALLAMLFVYSRAPMLSKEDAEKIKLPKNLDDAKDLGKVISNYKDDYFDQVVIVFVCTYVFLQSFAIPGSIFLSILSGFMFPFPLALFLVCFCSASGASLCYLISSVIGKKVVHRFFPQKIKTWKAQVAKHKKDILSYITFLRITPFLPNWFINIASPVLNVPLWPFYVGTFIGVAPPSFGFISAGVELYELTTTGDAFSFKSIALVVVSAIISLLPVMFRSTIKKKLQ